MEKKQVHIAYGLVTGIVTVVFYLVIYIAGVAFKPGMSYIPYIPFLAGIIINAMAYSKANDGAVTFGNVFGSCFKATMIITLILVAWVIICMFIFPEMKQKAMEVARESMAKNPQMTDEIMDKSMAMMQKGYTTIVVSATLFGSLFFGAIFSLIGGAIAKKNAVQPMGENN